MGGKRKQRALCRIHDTVPGKGSEERLKQEFKVPERKYVNENLNFKWSFTFCFFLKVNAISIMILCFLS